MGYGAVTVLAIRFMLQSALEYAVFGSPAFWILYAAAALTDLVGGTIMRKVYGGSSMYAWIERLEDCVFIVQCAVVIVPELRTPGWLLAWAIGIILCRAAALVDGVIRRGSIPDEDTWPGRIADVLLYILPPALLLADPVVTGPVVCAGATAAALWESRLINNGRG